MTLLARCGRALALSRLEEEAVPQVLAGTYGTLHCVLRYQQISNLIHTDIHLDAASRPKIMSKSLPLVLEEI